MQHTVWLFDEAWSRRRRRHRHHIAALLVCGAAAAGVLVVLHDNSFAVDSTTPSPKTVQPSQVLSRTPYLGVRCPIANSIACDRVGLAVWLKRPAISVTATIAGAPVALDWFGDERLARDTKHREFDGYLQPAGIVSRLHIHPVEGTEVLTSHGHTTLISSSQMWFGEGDAPPPQIRLTIHYQDGQTLVTHLRVGLAAGWG